MKRFSSFSELPSEPAIYALYGGQEKTSYVAYVGQASSLKSRITQHLIRRDSSVTTGVNAVSLNPDRVTKVSWWEYSGFHERPKLTAAELVAFDVLEPILRSRGNVENLANQLYNNESFYREMRTLFEGEPAGHLIMPTLQDAFKRILELEKSLAFLQKRMEQVEKTLKG